MFSKIIVSFKDGSFFKKVYNKFKLMIFGIIRKCFESKINIKNDKIMFLTFQGSYNCNPKAVADEIIRQKLPYELVWVVKKDDLKNIKQYPKELKLVRKNTLKLYKEAASCKVFVENANNFEYLKMHKKEGQYILQPWHGAMGFKRLDPGSVKNENWVKKAMELDKITDYCIVNSDFEIDVFRSSYWPTTEMLKYGHPRNDILFNKNGEFEKYSKKVRERYNIDDDVKIAMYAPTYRDDASLDSYNLDFGKLHEALVKRFGGKWCILLRMHYKIRNMDLPKNLVDKVVNVTDYPDMQELLCVCDFGITDYSSWMCDYVLTRKPGFLYTSDIEKYVDERGFYYPLESTPFPVCKTNEELYEAIISFDENKYLLGVDKFLKDRGSYEEGDASKKVVEKIKEITGYKE